MTELHKALMAFWQQFGIPVFLAGCVDDQTPFPYFVIEIADGNVGGNDLLTATSWHRRKDGESLTQVMLDRLDLIGRVMDAIHPGGVMLTFDGGYAIMYRNDASFVTYRVDETDPDTIGARIAYELQYYHM